MKIKNKLHHRTSAKRRSRKNPPPLFYTEVEKVVGQNIEVFYSSDRGYYSIFDELFGSHIQYSVIYDNHKNYYSEVWFNLKLIKQVIKKIDRISIELESSNYDLPGRYTIDHLMHFVGSRRPIFINKIFLNNNGIILIILLV